MRKIAGLFMMLFFAGLYGYAQSSFDAKITETLGKLKCPVPSEEEPVTLNASLVVEKDSVAVIVKVQIAAGWHIYQYVPPNMPYIAMDHVLKIPKGLEVVGKWKISPPFASVQDKGVMIYENAAWFVHKMSRKANFDKDAVVQTGLYFQTCNLYQCMPPVEKSMNIRLELN